jgi:hypothetical protein
LWVAVIFKKKKSNKHQPGAVSSNLTSPTDLRMLKKHLFKFTNFEFPSSFNPQIINPYENAGPQFVINEVVYFPLF